MRTSPEEAREATRRMADRRDLQKAYHAPPDNRLLQQAAVATQHLTALPEWDVFLQRVSAWVEADRKALTVMGDHLALPNLTNEQILMGQRHMLAAKERINAWEMVLRLPKEIIETHQSQTTIPDAAA